MNTVGRSWGVALFLGLLLGSVHTSSFLLPVLRVGNSATGEALIWDGETVYSLTGWQACKLLFLSARNDSIFFSLVIVPAFGVIAILANPVYWLALCLFGMRRWWGATVAGFIATMLAAVAYWTLTDQLQVGYYLWLSSMVTLTVAGLSCALSQRSQSRAEVLVSKA